MWQPVLKCHLQPNHLVPRPQCPHTLEICFHIKAIKVINLRPLSTCALTLPAPTHLRKVSDRVSHKPHDNFSMLSGPVCASQGPTVGPFQF